MIEIILYFTELHKVVSLNCPNTGGGSAMQVGGRRSHEMLWREDKRMAEAL